jgi:hypothetical protein
VLLRSIPAAPRSFCIQLQLTAGSQTRQTSRRAGGTGSSGRRGRPCRTVKEKKGRGKGKVFRERAWVAGGRPTPRSDTTLSPRCRPHLAQPPPPVNHKAWPCLLRVWTWHAPSKASTPTVKQSLPPVSPRQKIGFFRPAGPTRLEGCQPALPPLLTFSKNSDSSSSLTSMGLCGYGEKMRERERGERGDVRPSHARALSLLRSLDSQVAHKHAAGPLVLNNGGVLVLLLLLHGFRAGGHSS